MNANLSRRGLAAATLTATVALALAACSSPSTSDPGGTGTTAPSSAPATKVAARHSTAPGALSGKWSGHYSGAFDGTFTVNWRQTGSHLHGTIKLSDPGDTLPINGNVNGSSISFGTVGSTAITYSGTVSGNSMSGTYKVHSASGATGGPWSASKA